MTEYTQTYAVVILPSEYGWTGYCLDIPECVGKGQGKQVAYKAVKETIRTYLRRQIRRGQPLPRRIAVVKYPRFDLRELGVEVNDLR